MKKKLKAVLILIILTVTLTGCSQAKVMMSSDMTIIYDISEKEPIMLETITEESQLKVFSRMLLFAREYDGDELDKTAQPKYQISMIQEESESTILLYIIDESEIMIAQINDENNRKKRYIVPESGVEEINRILIVENFKEGQ